MFKPVLRWAARLLPFVAALLASVAVGASTHNPDAADSEASPSVARHREPVVALRTVDRRNAAQDGPRPVDRSLIARADTPLLLATSYPVESLDTALTAPVPAASPRAETQKDFEWPRPDRGTALLATLALGAFFFLRRIV